MTERKDNLREIRKANLEKWFEGKPMPVKDKSIFSQIKNNKSAFGERLARRIENDYGMPAFYLDQAEHNEISPIQTFQDEEHTHRIDFLDVRAAAGLNGFENDDYPELIQRLYLSDDGMLEIVGKKNSDGVCIIRVPTDSMEPTIRKSDIVFIDTKLDFYNGDGIYAFQVNGQLFIKRMQRMITGGYKLLSDNPSYETEVLTDDHYTQAKFVGKFIRTVHIETVDL